MAKGELLEQLKHMPDDTPITVNVEIGDENWDCTITGVMADSVMCHGYAGCTHTEPELDNELVIFVTAIKGKRDERPSSTDG